MYSACGGYRRAVESLSFPVAGADIVFTIHADHVFAEWIPRCLKKKSPATRPPSARTTKGTPRDPRAGAVKSLVADWKSGRAVDRKKLGLLMPKGPEFFVACWRACTKIPRGQTRSYAWLAAAAGRPKAARAAAQAMAKNPLSLIVPCHRVTGTGNRGGFCGAAHNDRTTPSAIAYHELKDRLLEIERSR